MESNQQHKTSIKDTILGKIKSEELSMYPKYYFVLRVVAMGIVALGILIISIFIFNFILFSIHINSQHDLLFFGPRGWGAFLYFFPWPLLALDALLVLALLVLLRQFRFGYKNPLLFVLLGIVLVTIAAGLLVDRTTGINEHFLQESEARRLPPPLRDFYGNVKHDPPPEFREQIEARRHLYQ